MKTNKWTKTKVLPFCRTRRYNPQCLSRTFAWLQPVCFHERLMFLTHKLGVKYVLAVLSESSGVVDAKPSVGHPGQSKCSVVKPLLSHKPHPGTLQCPRRWHNESEGSPGWLYMELSEFLSSYLLLEDFLFSAIFLCPYF